MTDLLTSFDRALARHQAGDLQAAERLYRAILAAHPGHADATHLLGVTRFQQGDLAEAEAAIRRAIAADPKVPMYHGNLGRVLMAAGRAKEAAAAYRDGVALAPDDAALHSDMAAALVTAGDFDAARARARLAIELAPDLAPAHLNLGLALEAAGGMAAREAEASFRRAAELDPGLADAHQALGQLAQARGDEDAALEHYRRAIQARPGMVEAHCNLGNILRERQDYDAALVQYEAALATAPGHATLMANKAVTLHEMGRFEDALAAYAAALARDPDDAECRRNRAMTLLLLGRLEEAWPDYEWRWKTARFAPERRTWRKPRWTPSEGTQGTVLVHAEQGMGDCIQFARYLPRLRDAGQHVVLECPEPLVRLMQSVDGVVQVVARGDPLPSHDFHIPLMSLPGAMETTLASIPADVPYVVPNRDEAATWAARLAGLPRPRIGLAWKGSARHPRDRVRSPGLASLLPLLDLAGGSLVSLQRDGGAADLAALDGARRVIDVTPDLGDFAATAALLPALDVVVACDTAVAHLAGALGRPTLLMLPLVPDWRWLLERRDSPWYPTLRLFRQERPGDWDGVAARVKVHLNRHWM